MSRWRELSHDAAVRACRTYDVDQAWIPIVASCTLGIIAVESRFGRSPRYQAKRALRTLLSRSHCLKRLTPRAQGIAQIDQDRAEYLVQDSALDHDLRLCSRDGAIEATALGLAKAISLHYPAPSPRPSQTQARIILITHNAGWMVPRVARLQESLVKLDLLPPHSPRTGFAGPMTLSALGLAASRFGCPTLCEVLRGNGLTLPVAWGLMHPDLAPIVRQSDLFRSLDFAARQVGEDLDEPRFPCYRFRRLHTGWISSAGYARTVLAHAEGVR